MKQANSHQAGSFIEHFRSLIGAAALFSLLLSGCAAPPVQTQVEAPPGWVQQQQDLAQITDWQLTGKLGVRQDNRIDSAVINHWRQQDQRFDINLSSAVFGFGATSIQGTPDAIWLTRSGEEPLYSDDPEALIRQQVGWSIPLRHLLYWVKGIPAPTDIDTILFDQSGNLYQLNQAGWDILYESYHTLEPYALPRKVVLRRDNIRLTFVISNWNI